MAGFAACATIATGVALTSSPAFANEVPVPDVVPSIAQWQSVPGSLDAGEGLHVRPAENTPELTGVADILTEELQAVLPAEHAAGDPEVVLVLDPDRAELGAEGYELAVGSEVTITGATRSGVFYGTRTLVQMLMQQTVLPGGSTVDVPEYEERGVTVCACVINISPEFIDRLITEMSFLKLNTLMVELKVKIDKYPQTNTWSYYTKDDVRRLVERAEARGITVIPEINSPGHMEIWLENMPELQLTNPANGRKDEVRLDITQDAAFEFYTDLMDEYAEVFTAPYWHLGVDEYMLGSGYANYPQIRQFAEAKFGAGATENDVVAWYVNRINDYVKERGKSLRIWNDGVMADNKFVRFDTDILVEHWNQAGSSIRPSTFLKWGHQVNNVSNSLYMVRGGYGVNSRGLYDSGWTPNEFYGEKLPADTEGVIGARMSIWPDGGTPKEAENVTEERMFEPLRFVAQATWTNDRPWAGYDAFKATMNNIGRAPLWGTENRQPVAEGSFTITDAAAGNSLMATGDGNVTVGESATAFTLAHTSDGYYTIKNATGQCLDLSRTGTMRLNVPVQIGAGITTAECADTTLQKWQLRQVDGGYTIANAASQQSVVVSPGLTNVPVAYDNFGDVAAGGVIQAPHDWATTTWVLNGSASLSATTDAAGVLPGNAAEVTVTATNSTDTVIADAKVAITELPDGWTGVVTEPLPATIAAGETGTAKITLVNVKGYTGAATAKLDWQGSDGTVHASTQLATSGACSTEQLRPSGVSDVSSEQLSGEPAPNGPAAAAIDGDPATYWHTQWSPTEARYPHAIVVDLGESRDICGLWYTGRSGSNQGAANGRIAQYEVYTSATTNQVDGDWGDAVVAGNFANTATAQLTSFAPVTTRYVKLVALSEAQGNPWATIGELAVTGTPAPIPEYTAAITLDHDTAQPGDTLKVSGTGFAPGELVNLSEGDQPEGEALAAATITAQADLDGNIVADWVVAAEAAGSHTITATGAVSGAQAEATFTVAETPGGADADADGGSDAGAAADANGGSGSGNSAASQASAMASAAASANASANANGAAKGAAKGAANGAAKGAANGASKGAANGASKGNGNGSGKKAVAEPAGEAGVNDADGSADGSPVQSEEGANASGAQG
ncbi:hexosaminidase [Leucobacter exalbidus]|uniref:Hexosaminidase n=1 Tax=Leucobacter exalbidus TaxID=662960 RepID=A0A940PU49_9MICO|nr:hexosaminidase [Leucobacter exalbidus]